MNKKLIGKNASVLLKEIGVSAGDEIRQVLVEVARDHPLVVSEQMMPIMPLVRVRERGRGHRPRAEGGARLPAHRGDVLQEPRPPEPHGAGDGLQHLRQERPALAGLGYGGEGFCSFTIASPTGEGMTHPVSFSRIRRCILKDAFRIV